MAFHQETPRSSIQIFVFPGFQVHALPENIEHFFVGMGVGLGAGGRGMCSQLLFKNCLVLFNSTARRRFAVLIRQRAFRLRSSVNQFQEGRLEV